MRKTTFGILSFLSLLSFGSMGHFTGKTQGVVNVVVSKPADTTDYKIKADKQEDALYDSLHTLRQLEPPEDPNAPKKYSTTTYINGKLTNTVLIYQSGHLKSRQYIVVKK